MPLRSIVVLLLCTAIIDGAPLAGASRADPAAKISRETTMLELLVRTADGRPAAAIEVQVRSTNSMLPEVTPELSQPAETPSSLGRVDAPREGGGVTVPAILPQDLAPPGVIDLAVHRTDGNGRVTFSALPRAPVIIELRAQNRLVGRDQTSLEQPTVSHVVRLPAMRQVRVVVIDARRARLGGAQVITSTSPVGYDHTVEGTTDSNGTLMLELPAMPLTVLAGRDGRWGRVVLSADARDTVIGLDVPASVRIEGRDNSGNPVKGFSATAELHVHPAWALETLVRSDGGSGAVEIPRGLADGALTVTGKLLVAGRRDATPASRLDLDPGAIRAQLLFAATPTEQQGRERVFRVEKKPAGAGPDVAVVWAQNAHGLQAWTKGIERGEFRLDAFPAEPTFAVTRFPRQSLIWKGVIDGKSAATSPIFIVPTPVAQLTLTLAGERTAEPIACSVEALNEAPPMAITLDRPRPVFANVPVILGDLPSGRLRLMLIDREQRAMIVHLALQPGERRDVRLEFAPVQNRVVLAGAKLRPGDAVRLSAELPFQRDRTVALTADATAVIENLAPGRYHALAADGEATFDISETDSLRVSLEPRHPAATPLSLK